MSLGLINAPATFMKAMNDIFSPLIDKTVGVYLDDILTYSKEIESHCIHVREVLDILKKEKFYAKKSKCEFAVKQVEFLGYIISRDGIATDPKKVKTVVEWDPPTTVKQVQRFSGFVGFYRKFISNFAQITNPFD